MRLVMWASIWNQICAGEIDINLNDFGLNSINLRMIEVQL